MLASDWNDSLAPMNRGGTGGAESVFCFFSWLMPPMNCWNCTDIPIGRNAAGRFGRRMNTAGENCRRYGMDNGFCGRFTPEGKSTAHMRTNGTGCILIPQSWSVLSRLPDAGQANWRWIGDEVPVYPEGLLTHTPASSGFDRQEKGYYLFTAGRAKMAGYFSTQYTGSIALALPRTGGGGFPLLCGKSA